MEEEKNDPTSALANLHLSSSTTTATGTTNTGTTTTTTGASSNPTNTTTTPTPNTGTTTSTSCPTSTASTTTTPNTGTTTSTSSATSTASTTTTPNTGTTTSTSSTTSTSRRKKLRPPVNMWHYLPREMGRIVCLILGDVDMLGYLNAISTEWVIHADELIYQEVATRIYLSQTDKKLLNVHKWGTWLNMLKNRPRLRTNGFYSLRTSYWKPPCNDAFWEEKKREFTEVKFFRHFRFYNDGTCLYAMNNTPPRDMRLQLEAEKLIHKKLYEGRYSLQRDEVTVDVTTHYCRVRFRLRIQHLCGDEEGGYDCDYAGNHNSLKIMEHSTLPLGNHGNHADAVGEEVDDDAHIVDENNRVTHALPQYANLLFHREWFFHHARHQEQAVTLL